MGRVARKGEVYHLWCRPHNFGHYPLASFSRPREILNHFSRRPGQIRMKSMIMGEVGALVVNGFI